MGFQLTAAGCLQLTAQGCLKTTPCRPSPPNTTPCLWGCCQHLVVKLLGSSDLANPTTWTVDGAGVVHITGWPGGISFPLRSSERHFDCPLNVDQITRLSNGRWQWLINDGDYGTLTTVSSLWNCPPAPDWTGWTGLTWVYVPNPTQDPASDGQMVYTVCVPTSYLPPPLDVTLLVNGLMGQVQTTAARTPVVRAYNAGTTYGPGDRCVSAGRVYVCVLATTGHVPPNATYWTDTRPVLSGRMTYRGVVGSNYVWEAEEVATGGRGAILMLDGTYWDNVQLSFVVDTTVGTPALAISDGDYANPGLDYSGPVAWNGYQAFNESASLVTFPIVLTVGVAP